MEPMNADTSDQTMVVSSHGDVITYKEHCRRMDAYLDTIKSEATAFTASNRSLTSFITQLRLVHGSLSCDSTSCHFRQVLVSKASASALTRDDSSNASAGLDDSGRPALYYAFLGLRSNVMHTLIGEYLLPRLARDRKFVRTFVRRLMTSEGLGWDFRSERARGNVDELRLDYREPDYFWLVLPHTVHVLVGTFDDLQAHVTAYRDEFVGHDVFLVDRGQLYRDEDEYEALLAPLGQKPAGVWTLPGIARLFDLEFRDYVKETAPLLKLDEQDAYRLGKVLSDTLDDRDQLVEQLRTLAPGSNVVHEDLVRRILTFCFDDEFVPFQLKEQVSSVGGRRRRDFIVYNTNAKKEFWRHLRSKGVEVILFDAKNYAGKLSYDDLANTIEYLTNPAFGQFLVIVSRRGMSDYGRLLEAYLARRQVVVVLTDDDLVAMIDDKREGRSPTDRIEAKYHEFLTMK